MMVLLSCRGACVVLIVAVVAFDLAQDAACHLGGKPLFPVHSLRIMLDTTGSSQLTPNMTTFTANGQAAAVTVKRPAASADAGDIVALYTHPSDPRNTVPVTWINITALSPAYPSTGTATVVFKLLNFRSNFMFRLLANETFSPVVLAESRVISNAIPNAPSQVHLALHADGRSMVVQWVSGSSKPQQLQFSSAPAGLNSKSKPSSVLSTTRTYVADMMCGVPATTFGYISPGFMHSAVIPDVGYSKRVQYRVGSDGVGWSRTFSFNSPPDPDAVSGGRANFTFLVFNDVGQENAVLFNETICPPYCPLGWAWVEYTANSTKLVKHLLEEKDARLGLLIGDLAYANGVQADWDYFGHQFEGPFSSWPLAVAPGNHERDHPYTGDALGDKSADSGGECNVPYTYRYYTPAWEAADPYGHKGAVGVSKTTVPAKPSSNPQHHKPHEPWGQQSLPRWLNPYKSYYSFNMANVHFLMLDSESASNPGSSQYQFVVNDLAKLDRKAYPWLVVSLHRMMAGPTTNTVNVANMARLQSDYEALFIKYKVDMVLQGHEHAYARTCPLYMNKCTASSTGRGSTGTAAAAASSSKGKEAGLQVVDNPTAPIYVLAGHAGAGFTHAFPEELPEWVEYGVQDQNGYLRVTVSSSSLTMVSISTDDGHVMDGVKIVKSRRQQH